MGFVMRHMERACLDCSGRPSRDGSLDINERVSVDDWIWRFVRHHTRTVVPDHLQSAFYKPANLKHLHELHLSHSQSTNATTKYQEETIQYRRHSKKISKMVFGLGHHHHKPHHGPGGPPPPPPPPPPSSPPHHHHHHHHGPPRPCSPPRHHHHHHHHGPPPPPPGPPPYHHHHPGPRAPLIDFVPSGPRFPPGGGPHGHGGFGGPHGGFGGHGHHGGPGGFGGHHGGPPGGGHHGGPGGPGHHGGGGAW